MSDPSKWTRRLFWLVLVLGLALIAVEITYGTQNLEASRKLKLDKEWMDAQTRLNINFNKRLKRLEDANAH